MKISNVFTSEELTILNNSIMHAKTLIYNNGSYIDRLSNNSGQGIDYVLGRLQLHIDYLIKNIYLKLNDSVNAIFNKEYIYDHSLVAEYSNAYGKPNLPPHYDGDSNHLIVNYQLSSNSSWDIAVGMNLFEMEDNSAILFNGNENIHWRPHKVFKDGEYVTMIFFRFKDPLNNCDYSHLRYMQDHMVFSEINKYRNSLNQ